MEKTKPKQELLKVRPKNMPLRNDNNLWEDALQRRGFNELPESEQYGFIVGVFEIENGYRVVDVEFPALNVTMTNIFTDEIVKI